MILRGGGLVPDPCLTGAEGPTDVESVSIPPFKTPADSTVKPLSNKHLYNEIHFLLKPFGKGRQLRTDFGDCGLDGSGVGVG